MNVYVRSLSCVALLGTALLTLGQYRPPWAARYSLDWWSLPEMHEQLRDGQRTSDDLQTRCDAVTARLAAKQEVTEALLAGRLTLPEAAARFRKLNASAGTAPTQAARQLRGGSEEECLCRQVIGWAEGEARWRCPESAAPTRQRFEAELRRLLARGGGKLILPE